MRGIHVLDSAKEHYVEIPEEVGRARGGTAKEAIESGQKIILCKPECSMHAWG
jgi:hypothetical protein